MSTRGPKRQSKLSCREYDSLRVLNVDLQPLSLFVKTSEKVPQQALTDLLMKYGGYQPNMMGLNQVTYQLTKLPNILVVQVKRFLKNQYFTEKNPSLVMLPLDQIIDLRQCKLHLMQSHWVLRFPRNTA